MVIFEEEANTLRKNKKERGTRMSKGEKKISKRQKQKERVNGEQGWA